MGMLNRVLLLPLILVAQALYTSETLGLSAQEINDVHPDSAATSRAVAAKVQILLDRARFSPGVFETGKRI
jgi:3-hydroxyisobutyrate dehydrogenase-like beta-hydroxyacid dehydrogenase